MEKGERMRFKFLAVLTGLLVLVPAVGQAEERSLFLQKVYMSFCLKHFDDYGALRTDLIAQGLPRLPPEQAAHFLQGQEGDVWPVPYEGQFGQFVLVLPQGNNLCAVMARRADPDETAHWFSRLAATAPEPLEVKQVQDLHEQTPLSGDAHTLAWRWATPGAEQALQLTLTTADNEEAAVQAMASLAIIRIGQQER